MGGEGAGSTTMKPFTAFNTFINVLMASGPILLPMQVAGAGFGFSLLCLIACCIISMIACEFIIEVRFHFTLVLVGLQLLQQAELRPCCGHQF